MNISSVKPSLELTLEHGIVERPDISLQRFGKLNTPENAFIFITSYQNGPEGSFGVPSQSL